MPSRGTKTTRRGMARAALAIAAGGAVAVTAVVATSCSTFAEETRPTPEAGLAPETGADADSPDAATGGDGAADSSVPPDAARRTTKCGATTCDLDANEICCVQQPSSGPTITTCVAKGTCNSVDAGVPLDFRFESGCDDSTDCAPGLVCCNELAGSSCSATFVITSLGCVAPASCQRCPADGGKLELCDPSALDGGCRSGSCAAEPPDHPHMRGRCID